MVKNGLVINPQKATQETADLYLDDGKIVGIGEAPRDFAAETTIDASGRWVMPGLVDASRHGALNLLQLIAGRRCL